MKKAKCGDCKEVVKGTTTRKIKKEATAHWLETGHRRFEQIAGWGRCTFPPLSTVLSANENADRAANATELLAVLNSMPDEELFEEAPVAEPDEEEDFVTHEDLVFTLRDYVDRNALDRAMEKVKKTGGPHAATSDPNGGEVSSLSARLAKIEERLQQFATMDQRVREVNEKAREVKDLEKMLIGRIRELSTRVDDAATVLFASELAKHDQYERSCWFNCTNPATSNVEIYEYENGILQHWSNSAPACNKHKHSLRSVGLMIEDRNVVQAAADAMIEQHGSDWFVLTKSKWIRDACERRKGLFMRNNKKQAEVKP